LDGDDYSLQCNADRYSVDPAAFTVATNPAASFNASLFDCAGLYAREGSVWRYVPPEASPAPCLLINTRTAKRITWLTNTVAGITFPADLGVTWRCETNLPSASQAARRRGRRRPLTGRLRGNR
jgi:hypothetical protein